MLSRKIAEKMEKEIRLPDVYRAKLSPYYLSISSAFCLLLVGGRIQGKEELHGCLFLRTNWLHIAQNPKPGQCFGGCRYKWSRSTRSKRCIKHSQFNKGRKLGYQPGPGPPKVNSKASHLQKTKSALASIPHDIGLVVLVSAPGSI